MEQLFRLFGDLPRQGPGSDASTSAAIDRLPPLPADPAIVDLGCGSGRQTLVLTRRFRTRVIAVDMHEPYLAELHKTARREDLADWIETRCVSMTELDFPPESLDLVWSEGAFYSVGVDRQLRRLRPLLRHSGALAFTELSWLIKRPSAEAVRFWRRYPGMRTVEQNVAAYQSLGFRVFDRFPLPASDWWDEYYNPLLERVAALRPEAADEPELATLLADTEQEIELYRQYGDNYGYVFYLCARGSSRRPPRRP